MNNPEGEIYHIMSKPSLRSGILSNGQSYYSPVGIFTTLCSFDLTFFPFDNQRCTIKLATWIYTTKIQVLRPNPSGAFTTDVADGINPIWNFVEAHVRSYNQTYPSGTAYSTVSLFFPSFSKIQNSSIFFNFKIEFEIEMSRKPQYYMIQIVLPSVVISVIELSIFTLPV